MKKGYIFVGVICIIAGLSILIAVLTSGNDGNNKPPDRGGGGGNGNNKPPDIVDSV